MHRSAHKAMYRTDIAPSPNPAARVMISAASLCIAASLSEHDAHSRRPSTAAAIVMRDERWEDVVAGSSMLRRRRAASNRIPIAPRR